MIKYSTSYNLSKKKPIIANNFDNKIKSCLTLNKLKKKNQGGYRTRGLFKHRSKTLPLVTIITVVKNSEKYLEESILSVLKQKYKNVEFLIIDGGSTDKTIQIIKKYEKNIDYWISKKDSGIYDAFNTGLKLANGNYIGFLNSDDIFTKNALIFLKKYLKKEYDFIFGSVKKHWGLLHGFNPHKIWYSWGFYTSHSSGFFIRYDAMKSIGKYNLKYKFSSDYDYLYRMIVKYKFKGTAGKKNEVFGIFRRGGFSSTIPFRQHFFEELKIRYDNGQNILLILLIALLKILYHFKKFVTNK